MALVCPERVLGIFVGSLGWGLAGFRVGGLLVCGFHGLGCRGSLEFKGFGVWGALMRPKPFQPKSKVPHPNH